MFILRALLATLLLTRFAVAQEHVSFPREDEGVVYADIHGKGERGVVLGAGKRVRKLLNLANLDHFVSALDHPRKPSAPTEVTKGVST